MTPIAFFALGTKSLHILKQQISLNGFLAAQFDKKNIIIIMANIKRT